MKDVPKSAAAAMARGKANLEIRCLRAESLEDSSNLPAPWVLAAEIVKELEPALSHFAELASPPIGEPNE